MIDLFPLIRPFIFMCDPEKAHNLTIKLLKSGLSPVLATGKDDPILKNRVFGLDFENPVGLAAGFDKNAEVMAAMLKAGFGFVEAGTVTPFPQEGNPLPRLFRLKEDQAVINRFGFNNDGLNLFKENLRGFMADRQELTNKGGILGANVGANKDAEDRTADYVTLIENLYGLADYFTVNISSPNTPGLRALQSKAALEDLVSRVMAARDKAHSLYQQENVPENTSKNIPPMPVLVKIAPDLLEQDKEDIATVAAASQIDGLIVSNTTIERFDDLKSDHKAEGGGLSGRPLFEKSTQTLSDIYRLTEGKIPLVGVGGIASGQDAYRKIRAGASLVQVYSMLVYKGPGLVTRIKRELTDLLKADGFTSVAEAIGADHR